MEKVSADTLNNQTLCNMVVSWVIGVPPNHPYFSGILTNINQPAIGGTPMTMETPYVSQQKILVISLIHSQFRITTTLMLPIQWIWNPQKHHPNTMAICPMIDAKTIIFSPFLLNTHRYFHCLVVWNMLDFSIYWISNNPNWQNHIFQRGGSTTYQRGWNLMKLYNGDQLLHCNSVNTIMEVVFFSEGWFNHQPVQPETHSDLVRIYIYSGILIDKTNSDLVAYSDIYYQSTIYYIQYGIFSCIKCYQMLSINILSINSQRDIHW